VVLASLGGLNQQRIARDLKYEEHKPNVAGFSPFVISAGTALTLGTDIFRTLCGISVASCGIGPDAIAAEVGEVGDYRHHGGLTDEEFFFGFTSERHEFRS